VQTKGPFENELAAYSASKALSYQAGKDFVSTKMPSFDVIHILPTFVVGRDDTVTEVSGIIKGTNGLLMGPLLGHARNHPVTGISVHVDDVAKLHVLSLDPTIEGNQDFLAAGPHYSSVDWADSFEIVKKHFPKEYEEGVFKFDSIPRPVTVPAKVDNAKARKTFGVDFKSFEEQVVSVVGHYLELSRQG
jgi:nucleoside-diphosphate-sugar epimerase